MNHTRLAVWVRQNLDVAIILRLSIDVKRKSLDGRVH